MRRRPRLPALILAAALLAACGAAPGGGSDAQRPPAEAPAPTTAQAAIPVPPPAPTAAQAATTAEAPAPTAAQAAPTAQAATTAEGLPQGRTAEGYPVLGDPAAPVTLTMYSDFL